MLNKIGKLVLFAAVWAYAAGVQAEVVIETVPVGNPGNPGDTRYPSGGVSSFGGVDYTYSIGKYEVTAGQYTAFLNAVAATDTYDLYDATGMPFETGCHIQRSGLQGSYTYSVAPDWANRPVNYVSWGDAARFANWLHNGQPTGAQGPGTTEDGSYVLNGAMTDGALIAVGRAPGATWVVPSQDEWYKAAYHKNDGVTGNYWDYPTGTDAVPSNDLIDPDPGNSATFSDGGLTIGAPYYRTEIGAHENSDSPYGTFDQGGNVTEWNESVVIVVARGNGGGWALSDSSFLTAWRLPHTGSWPTHAADFLGFRVAFVPGLRLAGDLNCDGSVNFKDLNPFVAVLTDPAAWQVAHPGCPLLNGDTNLDGSVNFKDINPFVACLTTGHCP